MKGKIKKPIAKTKYVPPARKNPYDKDTFETAERVVVQSMALAFTMERLRQTVYYNDRKVPLSDLVASALSASLELRVRLKELRGTLPATKPTIIKTKSSKKRR